MGEGGDTTNSAAGGRGGGRRISRMEDEDVVDPRLPDPGAKDRWGGPAVQPLKAIDGGIFISSSADAAVLAWSYFAPKPPGSSGRETKEKDSDHRRQVSTANFL